jgi:hypothetical protein
LLLALLEVIEKREIVLRPISEDEAEEEGLGDPRKEVADLFSWCAKPDCLSFAGNNVSTNL